MKLLTLGKGITPTLIMVLALVFGIMFWIIDGYFEYRFFHQNLSFLLLEGPETLLESLLLKIPVHSLFVRTSFMVAAIFGGVLTAVSLKIIEKGNESIRENETKFQMVFNNSLDPIAVFGGAPPKILFVNPAFSRLFGYTSEELSIFTADDIFLLAHPEDREMVKNKLRSRFRGENPPTQYESRIVTKNREVGWVEVSTALYKIKDQLFSQSIFRNITERKRTEETMMSALKEKELLLQEIHHRVKNNMQIIGSLLYLQATRAESEQVRQALTESQQRIHAMAMIHETLYDSQDLGTINLSEYLKRLVNHLQAAYNNQADIRIALDMNKVELDINQAVPCSLILNELITNVFKHAFPAGSKGTIQIKLYLTQDREVVLKVTDNGVGLAADQDLLNPSSLGLKLVQGLLKKQLKGHLDVTTEGGTAFTLCWPLPTEKEINA